MKNVQEGKGKFDVFYTLSVMQQLAFVLCRHLRLAERYKYIEYEHKRFRLRCFRLG